MKHASISCTLALAAVLLAACDKKPVSPPKPQSGTVVAAANVPQGAVADPSLPPAAQVLNEAPARAAGQDTTPPRANEELRKDEPRKAEEAKTEGANAEEANAEEAKAKAEEAKALRALRGETP